MLYYFIGVIKETKPHILCSMKRSAAKEEVVGESTCQSHKYRRFTKPISSARSPENQAPRLRDVTLPLAVPCIFRRRMAMPWRCSRVIKPIPTASAVFSRGSHPPHPNQPFRSLPIPLKISAPPRGEAVLRPRGVAKSCIFRRRIAVPRRRSRFIQPIPIASALFSNGSYQAHPTIPFGHRQ